jgi:flagellar P-ring protein precursor FlgI
MQRQTGHRWIARLFVTLGCLMSLSVHGSAWGLTQLKNICRVKGQEENVLRGLGLVVGLKGTGDSGDYLPTMRALARSMELLGNPIPLGDTKRRGPTGLTELKDTKNVALVVVEAVVPPIGARRGDKIDCEVSAISAKSLAGGRLVFAALQGPNVQDPRVYALASGRIHLDDANVPTVGSVHKGCRLEEDFFNAFQKDGTITLVLNKHHADFEVAAQIANLVNERYRMHEQVAVGEEEYLAKAIDPLNIVVAIPDEFRDDPVQFVAEVLGMPVYEPRTDARVVINERAGSIVIGGDVEIGAVVVSHKNVVVETTSPSNAGKFVAVDPRNPESPKLKSLVEALDALQVPAADVIEIIKGIDRNGKLHGQLIIE